MNSIIKTKFYLLLSTKTHVSIIVNYSYTLKWYLTIMPVNFYLNKRFFPHDITLIASVMGESVLGHISGGIFIPTEWRDAGVSDDRSLSLDLTATQID